MNWSAYAAPFRCSSQPFILKENRLNPVPFVPDPWQSWQTAATTTPVDMRVAANPINRWRREMCLSGFMMGAGAPSPGQDIEHLDPCFERPLVSIRLPLDVFLSLVFQHSPAVSFGGLSLGTCLFTLPTTDGGNGEGDDQNRCLHFRYGLRLVVESGVAEPEGFEPSSCCWILVSDFSITTAHEALEFTVPASPVASSAFDSGIDSGGRDGCENGGDDQFLFHDCVGLVFGFSGAGIPG
jgi:hypothetical protein